MQLTRLLLLALLLRAYVPVGFMPAAGSPFLLEPCPAAMAGQMRAQLHAHHHQHAGGHGRLDDCPFGSAPAAGPAAHVIAFETAAATVAAAVLPPPSPIVATRNARAHPPRGPPPARIA